MKIFCRAVRHFIAEAVGFAEQKYYFFSAERAEKK